MDKRTKINFTVLILLFILCAYLVIFYTPNESIKKIFFNIIRLDINPTQEFIITTLRYPRLIKCVVAGSCLALSGLLMQHVSKNPLAEPYLTGISSGAGLGMVSSILFFNSLHYSIFGFIGAMFSSLLVILFAGLNKFSITKLILIGLCVNVFSGSLISLAILTNPDKSYIMNLILSGGFSTSGINTTINLMVLYLIIMLVFALFVPKLNLLRIDTALLSAYAGKVKLYNALIVMFCALLASISVYAAGILGFVGIIAPQISNMMFKYDFRYLFFANILIGTTLLLAADFISRTLLYPLQIPLGLVIAFIGAPIFIFFLLKKGGVFNE